MKVALVQLDCVVGDKDANIKKMRAYAGKTDADILAFGEMALTGYLVRDDFRRLAEPINGRAVKEISEIASEHETIIVFGMPELDESTKQIFNTAVVAFPNGKVGRYRKWYLPNFGPFEEKLYFSEGSEIPVFETPYGRLGIIICYDLFFPELARAMALEGADILLNISASPITSRLMFERVFPARAIENTTFFLYVNLAGVERGMQFWGGSQVVSPRGDVLAKAPYYDENMLECELDMIDVRIARSMRPTLRDSRLVSNAFE